MKPPRRQLFLVRHGIAEGAEGRAVGQVDLPLAARGAASLRALAATWEGPPPDRLATSDLARAQGSAAILAAAWDLEPAVDRRLREVDFGAWDGLGWKQLEAREGPRLEAWKADWWRRPAPGGESFAAVAARARAWLDDLLADPGWQLAVAVAHGGSIRALLCEVLAMPMERAFHLHLTHGRVSALGETWRGLELTLLNADRFPARA